jgi:hypothetical protein
VVRRIPSTAPRAPTAEVDVGISPAPTDRQRTGASFDNPRDVTPPEPSQVAFALLEHLASRPGVRLEGTSPIQFELAPEGQTWSYDPRRQGPRFAQEVVDGAALRIRCAATLLLRLLLMKDFRLGHEDGFSHHGDLRALRDLVQALGSPPDPMGVVT